MMKRETVVGAWTLVLLSVAFVCTQGLPIPKTSPGIKIGNPAAPVLVEEFGDFQCSDCRISWPVVKRVLQFYGPDKVYFVFYVYPLWAHRQAWDVAKASEIVAKHALSRYWDFADYLFNNQVSFQNNAFFNKTENDLFVLLAQYASLFGVPKDLFYKEIQSDDINRRADVTKHFGIMHQVFGTPTFFVNGFKASDLDASSTLEDWRRVLDPLFR